MSKPLISVIIPAYNLEHYLSKTLDAVLAQTYQNLEILVVNDGSQDGTGSVLDAYAKKDARIQAIHKENGGVTSARLTGVRASHGDWITFVDGDDYIEPDMYKRLLQNALKYKADISHCGYQMILPSGKVQLYHGTGQIVCHNHLQGVRELLSGGLVEPSLWNKLYARKIFDRFFSSITMDTSIRINEDLLINYYLFHQAKSSVFEDFCPYHYIVRQGSAANSALNSHQLADPLKVKELIFEDTRTEPDLHTIIANHLVRQLVTLASMDRRKNLAIISPIQKDALQKLRHELHEILTQTFYSKKSKITAFWVSVFPASYRWVHTIYAYLTKQKQIYEK